LAGQCFELLELHSPNGLARPLNRKSGSSVHDRWQRLTENAEWDPRLLGEQLKALSEIELDFDLETTGFEMGEIDVL
jgi:hypothetical protein